MTVSYNFTCLFVIINIHIPSPSVHDPKLSDKTYVICILSTEVPWQNLCNLYIVHHRSVSCITMTIAQLIHPREFFPYQLLLTRSGRHLLKFGINVVFPILSIFSSSNKSLTGKMIIMWILPLKR